MNTEKHRLVKELKKSVSHFYLLSNKSIGLVRPLTQLGVQMSNELLLPVEKVQPESISPPLTERLLEFACSKTGRNMTSEKWARYMGEDTPYRKTCPNWA